MINIKSKFYGFEVGGKPTVGIIYMYGEYPHAQKGKAEYPMPLDVDLLLEKEPKQIGWALLKLEEDWKGDPP